MEKEFKSAPPCPNIVDPDVSEFALWMNAQEDDEVISDLPVSSDSDERKFAKASGKFPMNRKQISEISKLLHQKIGQVERYMVSKKAKAFESTNLKGDFEKELEMVKSRKLKSSF